MQGRNLQLYLNRLLLALFWMRHCGDVGLLKHLGAFVSVVSAHYIIRILENSREMWIGNSYLICAFTIAIKKTTNQI